MDISIRILLCRILFSAIGGVLGGILAYAADVLGGDWTPSLPNVLPFLVIAAVLIFVVVTDRCPAVRSYNWFSAPFLVGLGGGTLVGALPLSPNPHPLLMKALVGGLCPVGLVGVDVIILAIVGRRPGPEQNRRGVALIGGLFGLPPSALLAALFMEWVHGEFGFFDYVLVGLATLGGIFLGVRIATRLGIVYAVAILGGASAGLVTALFLSMQFAFGQQPRANGLTVAVCLIGSGLGGLVGWCLANRTIRSAWFAHLKASVSNGWGDDCAQLLG